MTKLPVHKTAEGVYVTSQKEFWAIMDPKTRELLCSERIESHAIPVLFEREEFAKGVCGKKGKVVKVTLSW